MLSQLFPRKFARLVALPVLGQVADDSTRGYAGRGMAEAPGLDTREHWYESMLISGAAGIDSGQASGQPISTRA